MISGSSSGGVPAPPVSVSRARSVAAPAPSRYDIAETRLSALLRSAPDFAEAWHKRAALYYLLGRDDECLGDIRRTLELEPRHFAAMLHFAEILLGSGAPDEARFAFYAALCVHPHLPRARQALLDKP